MTPDDDEEEPVLCEWCNREVNSGEDVCVMCAAAMCEAAYYEWNDE